MTSHGKTSYETVTFEIHHSKNRIKIAVLTSGWSHGPSLCGVIFIKVVKTLVKTVSELKCVFSTVSLMRLSCFSGFHLPQ